jgi:hypothetical protein
VRISISVQITAHSGFTNGVGGSVCCLWARHHSKHDFILCGVIAYEDQRFAFFKTSLLAQSESLSEKQ